MMSVLQILPKPNDGAFLDAKHDGNAAYSFTQMTAQADYEIGEQYALSSGDYYGYQSAPRVLAATCDWISRLASHQLAQYKGFGTGRRGRLCSTA